MKSGSNRSTEADGSVTEIVADLLATAAVVGACPRERLVQQFTVSNPAVEFGSVTEHYRSLTISVSLFISSSIKGIQKRKFQILYNFKELYIIIISVAVTLDTWHSLTADLIVFSVRILGNLWSVPGVSIIHASDNNTDRVEKASNNTIRQYRTCNR